MRVIEWLHASCVYTWRVKRLSEHLARLIPNKARVLDVGCGDGLISFLMKQMRPDIDLVGLDVLPRHRTYIPVGGFDGRTIPCGDRSYDVVMFVDVLHHTKSPLLLLGEACRVSRKAILIKDHLREGILAQATLRLMDRIGNARYGVALPYNYWGQQEWFKAFSQLDLRRSEWITQLGLYPRPVGWIFERSLHFIAKLEVGSQQAGVKGLGQKDTEWQ